MSKLTPLILALLLSASPALAAAPETTPGADLDQKIAALIQQLAHEDYNTRESAEHSLQNLGLAAYEQLKKAADSDNPEIARRAAGLIELCKKEAARSDYTAARKAILAASGDARKGLLWTETKLNVIGAASLGQGVIAFMGNDTKLRCLDAATGKTLWSLPMDQFRSSYLRVIRDAVIVNDKGQSVAALSLEKGEEKWHTPPQPRQHILAIAPDGQTILIGDDKAQTSLVSAADGKARWTVTLANPVFGEPAIAEGKILMITRKGPQLMAAAHNADDGAQAWESIFTSRSAIPGEARNGVWYVGNVSGVTAIRIADGKALWEYSPADDAPAPVGMAGLFGGGAAGSVNAATSAPIADDSNVYFTCQRGLIAVNAKDGSRRWTFSPPDYSREQPDDPDQPAADKRAMTRVPFPVSPPAWVNGLIVVGSQYGLHAIAPDTGQELWRFETELAISARPLAAGDVVYFATQGIPRNPNPAVPGKGWGLFALKVQPYKSQPPATQPAK